jgi:hypothetical protein
VEGLHLPLMAVIDYRGFRLLAESILPISKSTLVYGTQDAGAHVSTKSHSVSLPNIHNCAGRTVVNKNVAVAACMQKVGARLNLMPHQVNSVEVRCHVPSFSHLSI